MTLNIRKLREQKKWSQRELSRRSGVPQASLSDIESHRQLPRKDHLEKIASALGVAIDELFKN